MQKTPEAWKYSFRTKLEGKRVGELEGFREGEAVGEIEGFTLGPTLGEFEGVKEGESVKCIPLMDTERG